VTIYTNQGDPTRVNKIRGTAKSKIWRHRPDLNLEKTHSPPADLAKARTMIGSKSKSRMNAKGVHSYSPKAERRREWLGGKTPSRKRESGEEQCVFGNAVIGCFGIISTLSRARHGSDGSWTL
jgi:hypothetical protein